MNKEVAGIAAFALLVAGGIVLLNQGGETRLSKNVDLFDKKADVGLIKEEGVEYYPGAKGYHVRPAAERTYPGVVMIHENRGLRPEIKATADQLAKEGYDVLAVDLFEGKVVETQDQARAITASFDQKKGTANLKAAAGFLRSKGAAKVASIGWCFGGGQSLQLALSGEDLDGTVIYYGRLATTTQALAPIKWPVLGIFAGNDQSISTTSVSQFDAALTELDVPHKVHVYPGVGHAFANPSGMSYAPNETKDAWAKTVAFLAESLR